MNAPDALLADNVRRLLARHANTSLPQADGDPRRFEALWGAVVDAGLPQALHGASGDAMHDALRDAVTIVREFAYHPVAAPIAEAIVANWLAGEAGWQPERRPVVVINVDDVPRATTVLPSSQLAGVPWARCADAVYALVTDDGRGFVSRVAADQWTVGATQANLADEPRDTLRLNADAVIQRAACSIAAIDVLALCALLRSAQMVGAMERTLDLALEHARTRVQFGRPIGNFQAVQQLLAQHANHVAAATAALDLAVDAWGGEHALLYAAIAKSRAGEAAGLAAETAHQVLGAMGYAMEHPLQSVTRQLWAWRDEYGNEAFWNAHIGEQVFAAGEGNAWAFITDEPSVPTPVTA